MNALTRASLRRPVRTLALVALASLAAAPGLFRLELRTDGAALIPRRSPAVVYDRDVRREMGLRDPVVAVVRTDHPGGIFNAGTLRRVRGLTAALGRLPGIGPADLTSLATEQGLRFRPGTLQRSTFLDPLPQTPAALAELRSEIRRIGVYDRALISADGAGTAIVLGVPPEADRAAFYRRVREIAASQSSPHDRIDVIGAPVAEALLGSHILADLGVPRSWLADVEGTGRRTGQVPLVPLSLAVMALVFLIGFRRPVAALLPLLKVGLCLAIVFGAMGWLGVPVYLTTAVLPVLLIAVGTASEVHLFRRYGALCRERPDRPRIERVRAAVEEVERPVLQAAATTAVGFLSFGLSPLGPVRAFGFFAAAGVLLCLLGSFTATPAFLALLPSGWVVRRTSSARSGGENAFSRVGRFAWRHRRAVLATSALLALLSLDGVRRVAVQDSWIDGFAPGSAFARQMRGFDRQFRGAHLLQVVVEAEPLLLRGEVEGGAVGDRELALPPSWSPPSPRRLDPARLPGSWIELRGRPALPWSSWIESARTEDGRVALSWPLRGGSPKFWLMPGPGERVGYEIRLEPLMVPAALRRVEGLEAFLGRRPGVGGTFGPAEFLKTAAFLMAPDAPGPRRLPDDPQAARILWKNSERVRGPERLRQLVSPGYSRGLVSVFLKDSNYAATGRLMSAAKAYERRFLAPHGVRLGFAGDVAVSQALIGAVVSTQVGSLGLSLLGIFAVTAGLSRSLLRGLLCVIPASFAVLLNFAAMGWLGIPLGVATSMFAGMTLGVGVDYAIHLLARFRREGKDGEDALARALGETGPAILIDSGSSLLGFAVLLASQVPANHRLGGLLALSLIDCFAATLLVVPALLAGRAAYFTFIARVNASGWRAGGSMRDGLKVAMKRGKKVLRAATRPW
ncbi:MAG: efflux RND transporter permease subunit [Thermoanaerobaculia bacterium]